MTDPKLTEAINSIDRELVLEAQNYIEEGGNSILPQASFHSGTERSIDPRKLYIPAFSIMISACLMAAALILFGKGENKNGMLDRTAMPDAYYITELDDSFFASGSGYIYGYFSQISVTTSIKNGSRFDIDCSYGIDRINLSEQVFNSNHCYYTCIEGVPDENGVRSEGNIFYFSGVPDRCWNSIPCENSRESLGFDFGTLHDPFNENGIVQLPYSEHYNAEVKKLNNGDSGVIRNILTVFGDRSKDDYYESDSRMSFCAGTVLYYYCSGDIIGFGKTPEEAYNNSLFESEQLITVQYSSMPLGTIEKEKKSNQSSRIYTSGCLVSPCINLVDSNNCFEKGNEISLTFELLYAAGGEYTLSFSPNNITDCTYSCYSLNGKRYFDISFVADSEENGWLDVFLMNVENGEPILIPQNKTTIYTANSDINTFISVASMNTAQSLAGQKIDQEVVYDEDSVTGNDQISVLDNFLSSINYESRSSFITVLGTIQWEDNAGETHPAKDITIEVYCNNPSRGLVATTTTDASGNYYTRVYTDSINSVYDISVKVKVMGANVTLIKNDNTIYKYDTTTSHNVSSGQIVSKPVTFSNLSEVGKAVSVHQGIALASNYIKSIKGSYYNNINVLFPSSSIASYYDGSQIYIRENDAFDWDIVEHEYGHYVEDNIGMSLIGGQHYLNINLEDEQTAGVYVRTKEEAIRLAWIEGWPTYFAILVQKEMNAGSLNIPYVGDSNYTNIEDTSTYYDINLETLFFDNNYLLLGEGNEISIAGALYDMTDPQNITDYDNTYCAAETIFEILEENQSNTFSEFVSAFLNSTYGTNTKLYYGLVLSHIKMSAYLSTPTGINSNSPTFNWIAQGGSTRYPNNTFRIAFYNSSFNLITRTSYTTNTTLTLSSTVWNMVKQNAGTTIYCCVETNQSDNPQTGVYYSNLVAITNPIIS